jgi:hypothetical protein
MVLEELKENNSGCSNVVRKRINWRTFVNNDVALLDGKWRIKKSWFPWKDSWVDLLQDKDQLD